MLRLFFSSHNTPSKRINTFNNTRRASTTPEDVLSITEKEALKENIKQNKDLRDEDKTAFQDYLGVHANHLSRRVRIYKHPKSASQQGWGSVFKWTIEFDQGDKWNNPLMGWTSSRDPLDTVSLEFENQESAINFCKQQGLQYDVEEDNMLRDNKRTYGSKFKYVPPPKKSYS